MKGEKMRKHIKAKANQSYDKRHNNWCVLDIVLEGHLTGFIKVLLILEKNSVHLHWEVKSQGGNENETFQEWAALAESRSS